ncbi:hypothetical protein DL98DRAFT_609283 [Cadophora sp. DSE1049]|nr:hypothetical protein DL98DRAFT_609283 [Cadophora sp. DSE1049]
MPDAASHELWVSFLMTPLFISTGSSTGASLRSYKFGHHSGQQCHRDRGTDSSLMEAAERAEEDEEARTGEETVVGREVEAMEAVREERRDENNWTRPQRNKQQKSVTVLGDDSSRTSQSKMTQTPSESCGLELSIFLMMTTEAGRPFILVIIYQALLDCLAVDTAVRGIFNFVSGSHGARAISLSRNFRDNLLDHHLNTASAPTKDLEQILIALPTAIHELLRRENRASFNDDLSGWLNSLEDMMDAIHADRRSVTFHYVGNKVEELRKIIARSRGLLHEEEPKVGGVTRARKSKSVLFRSFEAIRRKRSDS